LDESFLALNLINRTFLELLQPLDYNQGAPIGFIFLEKIALLTFGNSEFTLRLIPLLSGIASLFLFYHLARKVLKPNAVPIGLGLFALSDRLIYYSSELKQYASDVAIAILLGLATIYMLRESWTPSRLVFFSLLGVIVIWFSHPSVFILAGAGLSLSLICLYHKEWSKLGRLVLTYSLWSLSLAFCYIVSLQTLRHNKNLMNYWEGGFMPLPPTSYADAQWFSRTFFDLFHNPLGLPQTWIGVAAFAFIVGCISLFLNKRETFLILTFPILLTLFASGLHLYPFKGRLLLFMVPFLLLFIGEGAEKIVSKTGRDAPFIGIIFTVLLFYHPLISAGNGLVNPQTFEEIKPVINYVKKHEQTEDVLYLYHSSQYAFKYYSERFGYKSTDYIVGVSQDRNLDVYIKDLNKLRGSKRVWILFSHVHKNKKVNEEHFFLDHLDSIGTQLDSFKSVRASVYLYDLSG
jgi:hypothetical protein